MSRMTYVLFFFKCIFFGATFWILVWVISLGINLIFKQKFNFETLILEDALCACRHSEHASMFPGQLLDYILFISLIKLEIL